MNAESLCVETLLERGDWDYHHERERPGTGIVEEAGAIDTITHLWQASRHVVQRAFQLQPTQPLPLRKPVEHRNACVELEIQLVRVRRRSVGLLAGLNLSTMSKWELSQPRVRSPESQMKLVSNSSSGVLSRSNGRKIASTVNSSHDARVGRPRERMTSNSVPRGSRVVVPCSSTIRGEPNRFVNVTVGSTLNSGAHSTRQAGVVCPAASGCAQ